MKIKTLYNHHAEPVGKAYLHKRNATVDIKWLDSLQGSDTSIELHEYDEYKARFELLSDDERGQGRLF